MVKVKCGAIIKEISRGALKWYQISGWKILEEKNSKKKEEENDKTNSKEIASA